jgi:PAS domain S-box-containing protein
MNTSLTSQSTNTFCRSSPLWLRYCSLGSFVSSIGLLYASLVAYSRHPIFGPTLVPALVSGFSIAIFLNVYALSHLRSEHRRVDRAFRNTDCEFSSIFQNVLDGILIVDNEANCLDANPAAAAVLRLPLTRLIGQDVRRFVADHETFSLKWNSFLDNKGQRGHAQLIAGDGSTLFVDFTAAANYLPGRHVLILCDVTERTRAESSLRISEERFQLMANNIQEIFWMMHADSQELTYVNPAYSTLTGYAVESLHANPSAYQDLIYPEDRIRVLSKLRDLAYTGTLDEEFRFVRADGEVRWAWAKGVPVPADGETRWLVGTAQDITSRKQAEMKIIEQLDAVEAARAEAEALRKSTLALSQNLAMDSVLDTLLQCISELVPFDRATVLFVEDGFELMVAREAPRIVPKRIGLTFRASESNLLERVLFEKRAILVSDVAGETEWRDTPPLDLLHSWLGIPLVAAGHVLGILSLGSNAPHTLTVEHLRLAKSLAVPAAVAIQNARVHERAEIYAAELEDRLRELREARMALSQSEKRPPMTAP